MPVSDDVRARIEKRITRLYDGEAQRVLAGIDRLADKYAHLRTVDHGPLWSEKSTVLITYADQVRGDEAAIEVQRQFLLEQGLPGLISTVHLLPFFPYSSDDGFSVIDYREVNPAVGNWEDIKRLGESFRLMFDFVLNHCSKESRYFQGYLRGEEPYTEFFHEVDPRTDLSQVTRPRSSPLLTPFETNRGTRHVWTTFSADQVDLNFASPDLLLEMLDILLTYVEKGATTVRLDAVGFLWKRLGTNCMHLPETHDVVKLIRDVLDDVAPGVTLLTETNVPHAENVSYFGDGDEAHSVYQFSLAPLLLDAFLSADASPLKSWLAGLEYPSDTMTYFNFTASHDGIGVRPLEGLVPDERVEQLVDAVRERGGLVSTRRRPDGTDSPYELNITYLSALDTPQGLPADVLARKFLTSQGVMLALRGVPGIYFHSLVGTRNDRDGVERTGHNRAINRRKFEIEELRKLLSDERAIERQIFDGYKRLLSVRTAQAAFHPAAEQRVLDSPHDALLAFQRIAESGQRVVVLANLGPEALEIDLRSLGVEALSRDLLTEQRTDGGVSLSPFGLRWLGSS